MLSSDDDDIIELYEVIVRCCVDDFLKCYEVVVWVIDVFFRFCEIGVC